MGFYFGDILIALVLGGINSGKSAFAEAMVVRWVETRISDLTAAHNDLGVVSDHTAVRYIATMLPIDAETQKKIELHKARRPTAWQTSEPGDIELSDISGVASSFKEGTVLLDSVGTLLSLFMEAGSATVLGASEAVFELIQKISLNPKVQDLIIVSEEVGGSLVSTDALSRAYVSALGELNQKLASLSTEVYLVVAGQGLYLKKSDNFANLPTGR